MKFLREASVGVLCAFALHGCGESPTETPASSSTTSASVVSTKTLVTTTAKAETTTSLPDVWSCQSTRQLPNGIAKPEKKGIAVEDVTLQSCTDKIPGVWPHASDRMKSLRLFAAWRPEWGDDSQREQAWDNLVKFVHDNDAKVLMGSEVKCNDGDHQFWKWGLQLMQRIGREHMMGVSIGNELDNRGNNGDCWNQGLWTTFFDTFKSRISEMDAIAGFNDVPVTTVFTMGVFGVSEVHNFLQQAHDTWGSRFVWSFNPYPVWSPGIVPCSDDGITPRACGPNECHERTSIGSGIGFTKDQMTAARKSVFDLTQSDSSVVWATEAGWSAPAVSAQQAIAQLCPEWGDKETMWAYYKGLMEWDLTLNDGKEVDHLFYFAVHDARGEAFGLISGCGDDNCKVQGALVSNENQSSIVV